LEKIQCEKYNWNICEYLKVVAVLHDLQLGYTKFLAFCVSAVAGTENICTSKKSGLIGNHLLQDRKM
jgi:hypothetical protein